VSLVKSTHPVSRFYDWKRTRPGDGVEIQQAQVVRFCNNWRECRCTVISHLGIADCLFSVKISRKLEGNCTDGAFPGGGTY
jgi:hypothetical protein